MNPDRPGQPPHAFHSGGRREKLLLLLDPQGRGAARRRVAPALLDEGVAGEPAALRGWPDGYSRRPSVHGRLAEGAADLPRDPVSPGPRADAGLHRRPRRRRPCRDARRDGAARRRPAEDQSARSGPPGHRPQRDGRRVRQPPGVREERRARISAQRRALRVPQVGQQSVRQFPGRAAGDRHLPPGQSGEYRPMRLDGRGSDWRDCRLSRHARRYRQPYDHGQWSWRARLGRRRHRGRGSDARPAGQHADPGSRRLPA